MIDFSILIADDSLSTPTTLQSPSNIQSDPTIDHGGQLIIYVGLFLIIVCIAAIVGFFSRRVEHALITALALSLCLVALVAFLK